MYSDDYIIHLPKKGYVFELRVQTLNNKFYLNVMKWIQQKICRTKLLQNICFMMYGRKFNLVQSTCYII